MSYTITVVLHFQNIEIPSRFFFSEVLKNFSNLRLLRQEIFLKCVCQSNGKTCAWMSAGQGTEKLKVLFFIIDYN